MLNEMRLGRLTESSINTFHSLHRPLSFKEDFEATELYEVPPIILPPPPPLPFFK